VLATGESNQGDGGYDVLYTPHGPPRRLPAGPGGTPDYSHFPAALAYRPKPGVKKSAAGRYGMTEDAWNETVRDHPDVTDWTPLNQNKATWYYGASIYRRKTGRDLSADLQDESRWPGITSTLNPIWSSLPGGHGQKMTQEEFNQRLRDATSRYVDPHPND
jgi:muramidase (phage lysozyme)